MAQSDTKSVLALLGLFLLFMTGCPVDSSVPLSPASEAEIDMALVGRWGLSYEGKVSDELRIFPFNEHELVILICEYGKSQESQDSPLRAFTTLIGGERFLNVRSVSEDEFIIGPWAWTFINYTVNGDELRWRFVTDVLFTKDKMTSQELVELIKNNLHNEEELYGRRDAYEVLNRIQE